MHIDDAKNIIINLLKDPPKEDELSHYGYEIYLRNIIYWHLVRNEGADVNYSKNEVVINELSPFFMAAAWDLCLQGVLRPGITRLGGQSTDEGASGIGFSLTPQGKEWLKHADQDGFFIPTSDRFSQQIAPFREKLGDGFLQRATEANKAYFATAYLACTAMCGAAAESILLAAAIAKTGDERDVLAKYKSASGRSKIENILLGQATRSLKTRIKSYTDLLNYWRDEASHGTASEISEIEAHAALARLISFAHIVDNHWEELTS